MLTYLVPEGLVSGANPGGMHIKVHRVEQSLKGIYPLTVTSELPSDPTILLVEPLWFRMGKSESAAYDNFNALTMLKDCVKILYCSEAELLRWDGKFRSGVLELFDVITATTAYQRGFLESLGIKNLYSLIDPINPYLYRLGYPDEAPLVVAGGQISDSKNSASIYEIFSALRDTPCRTAYIGSSRVWRGWDTDHSRELEFQIESVCDQFYGTVSSDIVSSIFARASVFVADSIHDTSAQMQCESLMAGVPSVVGVHPVYRERPGIVGCRTTQDFVDGIMQLTNGFNEPPSYYYRDQIRSWSLQQFSYFAFQKQLKKLINRFLPVPPLKFA